LSSNARWCGVSSAIGQIATHFTASNAYPDGHFYQFLSPVGAVRLGSTSVATGTLSMRVMQGEIG
jgi:hypothetical protein